MNIPLFSHIFPKIGVDFGSSRVRVCTLEQGVLIDTPSCLAVHQKTKEVLAVGKEALELQGRVEGVVEVLWPIQNGVEDYLATNCQVQLFINTYLHGVGAGGS